jgi:hypothetical protein
VGTQVQFERTGYFCVDEQSASGVLTMNRIVTLRDTWGATTEPSKKKAGSKGGGKKHTKKQGQGGGKEA